MALSLPGAIGAIPRPTWSETREQLAAAAAGGAPDAAASLAWHVRLDEPLRALDLAARSLAVAPARETRLLALAARLGALCAAGRTPAEARAAADELQKALVERDPGPALTARIALALSEFHFAVGALVAAEAILRRAVDDGELPAAEECEIRVQLGATLARGGGLVGAYREFERAGRLAKQASRATVAAASLLNRANVLSDLGDLGGARLFHEQALEIATREGYHRLLEIAHHNLGVTLERCGEPGLSLQHLRAAMTVRTDMPLAARPPTVVVSLVTALLRLGKPAEATDLASRLIESHREASNRYGECVALSALAEGQLCAGDEASCLLTCASLAELAAPPIDAAVRLRAVTLAARARARSGAGERAARDLERAWPEIERLGLVPLIADFHEALAEAHEQVGRCDAAAAQRDAVRALWSGQVEADAGQRREQIRYIREIEARRQHEAELSREVEQAQAHAAELERKLRQAQTMEALGRLAGGVAHDFNNLLTVIQCHAELLSAAPLPPERRESVDRIAAAAERSRQLTMQLLAFSRKRAVQPRTMDLCHVVRDTVLMLKRVLGKGIEVDLDVSGSELLVLAEGGQLDQVVMNLVVNARDAMPQGGRIAVRVQPAPSADASPAARLSVRDEGAGISDDVLEHVFEPFFTTKPSGTGLGLPIVYGIVRQLGGEIQIRSTSGVGTEVEVTLPLVTASPTVAATDAGMGDANAALHVGRALRILLVDDEPTLRDVIAHILRKAGHEVLAVADGEVALGRLLGSDRYDLVVSDLGLPGLSGPELLERVAPQRPTMRFLFISGYPGDEVQLPDRSPGHHAFLQKPFGGSELRAAITELFGGNSG